MLIKEGFTDKMINLRDKVKNTYDYLKGNRSNNLGTLHDASSAEIKSNATLYKLAQQFNKAKAPFKVQIDQMGKKLLLTFNASKVPTDLVDQFKPDGKYGKLVNSFNPKDNTVEMIFDAEEDLPDTDDALYTDAKNGGANKVVGTGESLKEDLTMTIPEPYYSEDRDEFYLKIDINGSTYDFKMKDDSPYSIDQMLNKVIKMMNYSSGKALAFIKKHMIGVKSSKMSIKESHDPFTYEEIDSKEVMDSDGFYTEYTLYTNGENFICIFGDRDLYTPEDTEPDFETENEEEAREWFKNYNGFEDDLDESLNKSLNENGEFSWNNFNLKQGDLVNDDYDYDRGEGTSEYEIIDTISNSVIGYAKVFYDNEGYANVYKLEFNTSDIPDKVRRIDFAGDYPLEYNDDLSSYCKWLNSELHKRLNESLTEDRKDLSDDEDRRHGDKDVFKSKDYAIKSEKNEDLETESVDPSDLLELKSVSYQGLKDKLTKELNKIMKSPEFGFEDDEIKEYSGVEIKEDEGYVYVSVWAEVGFDNLWTIKDALDPIIVKYDKDAYFDMEDAGRLLAVISDSKLKESGNLFKSHHICKGCGKPLDQCTCEVKEEDVNLDSLDTEDSSSRSFEWSKFGTQEDIEDLKTNTDWYTNRYDIKLSFTDHDFTVTGPDSGKFIRDYNLDDSLNEEADLDLIKKAIKGDEKSIKSLRDKGYKVNKLVNPLHRNEVGTFEIVDKVNTKVYNYDNTLSHYSSSHQESATQSSSIGQHKVDSIDLLEPKESLNLDSDGKRLKKLISQLVLDSDEELRDYVNKIIDEVIEERNGGADDE